MLAVPVSSQLVVDAAVNCLRRDLRSGGSFMLEGKVTMITGASQGLGRALALAHAKERAQVVINSRSEESIRPVAREAESLGAEVLALAVDVCKTADVERLVYAAVERFGRID